MRITLKNKTVIVDPGVENITGALKTLNHPQNSIAVLEASETRYIQTLLKEDGTYVLEYQHDAAHHATGNLSLAEVIEAFIEFSYEEDGYLHRHHWIKLDMTADAGSGA